jgi:hypothetical protein
MIDWIVAHIWFVPLIAALGLLGIGLWMAKKNGRGEPW